jgi:hypothetical protein
MFAEPDDERRYRRQAQRCAVVKAERANDLVITGFDRGDA